MKTKKVLIVGIGKADDSKQRITIAFEKIGTPYRFVRWSDLSFVNHQLYDGLELLDLDEIGAAFFDIHRFTTTVKNGPDFKQEFDFHLENELHAFLTLLKEHGIYSPNRDFFLEYPFYNKFAQSDLFGRYGIPAIPTLHLSDNKENKVFGMIGLLGWKFPLVAKESYGARGSKVWKIENEDELKEFVIGRRMQNIVFQPFVENSADYRVIVVDNVCVGIMKRSAKDGEWKNNFSLGGDIARHNDEEMAKFAEDVCRKLNLDIAGLDVFATPQGYLVIEINLFFGLDGFESIHKEADVPGKIVDLINKNSK